MLKFGDTHQTSPGFSLLKGFEGRERGWEFSGFILTGYRLQLVDQFLWSRNFNPKRPRKYENNVPLGHLAGVSQTPEDFQARKLFFLIQFLTNGVEVLAHKPAQLA